MCATWPPLVVCKLSGKTSAEHAVHMQSVSFIRSVKSWRNTFLPFLGMGTGKREEDASQSVLAHLSCGVWICCCPFPKVKDNISISPFFLYTLLPDTQACPLLKPKHQTSFKRVLDICKPQSQVPKYMLDFGISLHVILLQCKKKEYITISLWFLCLRIRHGFT